MCKTHSSDIYLRIFIRNPPRVLMAREDGVNGRLLEVARPLVDRVMWLKGRECATQRVDVVRKYFL